MAWTDTSATVVTLNASTTDTLFSVAGSFSGISVLNADHRILLCDRKIEIGAGASWEERNAIIIQHRPGEMVNMADANGNVTFGEADLTDTTKPVVTHGVWFLNDQEANAGTAAEYGFATTSGTLEIGQSHIYGGVMEVWPCNNTAATGGIFWYMRTGETFVIGTNWTRYAGGRFGGTQFRLQEVKMMGSGRLGLSLLTTADSIGVKDLILQDMVQGYYFSNFQTGATRFRNTATRNTEMESVGLTSQCFIEDSDEVDALFATPIDMTQTIEETTSYNVTVTAKAQQLLAAGDPDAGDPLDDCEIRIVRTETRANDGAAWSTSNLQVRAATNTDANGQIAETELIRKTWRTGDNIGDKDGFRGFFVSARQYGFKPQHLPIFPEFGAGKGFVDSIIMPVDRFVAGEEASVLAYTGSITLTADDDNTADDTIDLTSAHTLQEVYDYLQWYMAQPAQVPFVANSGDDLGWNTVWTTPTSVSPLNTSDGVVFTIATGWTMTGYASNLTVGDQILEHANGNRIVPIQLLNVEEGSSYEIVRDSDQVVLYSGIIGEDGYYKTQRDWTTNVAVTVNVRLQGFLDFETAATIGNAGLVIAVNSASDINYKPTSGRMDETHFRWRDDDGSETGATWLVTEDTDYSSITVIQLYNGATGGTFTITIDGETTGTITYNAAAGTVDTTLEALASITSTTVTGAGTSGNPWIITFVTPGSVATFTTDDSGLTGGTPSSTATVTTGNVLDKADNIRLRVQIDEYKAKSNPIRPKIQYRRVTSSPTGIWADIE